MGNYLRRIARAVSMLIAVTVLGVVGYLVLGFPLLDAIYQTVTTVTTVGFREVYPLTAAGEIFTIVLIIVGVGTVLYNLSVLLEGLTEGDLRRYLERRAMDKRISELSGHVIVCGYGRVGRSSTEHLLATGHQVVVIDSMAAKLDGLLVPHLLGDVTNDTVLREAGIDRARALIGALESDADTMYLVLSARALRSDMPIIARARTVEAKHKMVLAGATRAVNPQLIGGRRIAAFALQPDVAEFLDVVMHDEELDFRIQQVRVADQCPLIGRTLGDLDLTGTYGPTILAVRRGRHTPFVAQPGGDVRLEAGSVIIAFGTQDQISALDEALGQDKKSTISSRPT